MMDWHEEEFCTHLITALQGQAREILSVFSGDVDVTSTEIFRALKARFGKNIQADVSRSSLSDLKQVQNHTLRQLSFEVEK